MDKYIAKQIVFAQVASDRGKNICCLADMLPASKEKGFCFANGYRAKDIFIENAIEAIRKGGKRSGFRYFVTDGGNTPFLVYFEYTLDGSRRQISFHSFNRALEKYVNYPDAKASRLVRPRI